MADSVSRVEVGVLEKCPEWALESRFFPSKVGGKPAWLDLKNISIDNSCKICFKPCVFLCQIYAPFPETVHSYHRTIFIFVCKDPECCRANSNENFKVFRCQLPQINDYYSPDEPCDEPGWCPENVINRYHEPCELCGCLGSYQCSKCKRVKYCSKDHQIIAWKAGHNQICSTENTNLPDSNYLFPEYEIIIDMDDASSDGESEKGIECEKYDADEQEDELEKYEELLKSGKAGTLQDIHSDMLEMFAFGKEDKFLKHFKSTLKICPDQVLRYEKGGAPLWITEPNLKTEDIPCCDNCQGPRQFEFQILPTLLGYLHVDNVHKSLDWGTLLIFTCKNNCQEGPAYKKEFLWKQDII